jgi:hypothetical protein
MCPRMVLCYHGGLILEVPDICSVCSLTIVTMYNVHMKMHI